MKRKIAIAKVILVIVLVIGYFFLVDYEKFHKVRKKPPVQKDLVITLWSRLALGKTNVEVNEGKTNDYFGSAVSISGNYAIAGAPQYDVPGKQQRGAAYVFVKALNNSGYSMRFFRRPMARKKTCLALR